MELYDKNRSTNNLVKEECKEEPYESDGDSGGKEEPYESDGDSGGKEEPYESDGDSGGKEEDIEKEYINRCFICGEECNIHSQAHSSCVKRSNWLF